MKFSQKTERFWGGSRCNKAFLVCPSGPQVLYSDLSETLPGRNATALQRVPEGADKQEERKMEENRLS